MARSKPIDLSPQLITIDFTPQILPGSFEYALGYLLDPEMELSAFEQRFRHEEGAGVRSFFLHHEYLPPDAHATPARTPRLTPALR